MNERKRECRLNYIWDCIGRQFIFPCRDIETLFRIRVSDTLGSARVENITSRTLNVTLRRAALCHLDDLGHSRHGLLINCHPTLFFRRKWGGRVDSHYRGGIQISLVLHMANFSLSLSFFVLYLSTDSGNLLFFFPLAFKLGLFCFEDIPKSPRVYLRCNLRGQPFAPLNYT